MSSMRAATVKEEQNDGSQPSTPVISPGSSPQTPNSTPESFPGASQSAKLPTRLIEDGSKYPITIYESLEDVRDPITRAHVTEIMNMFQFCTIQQAMEMLAGCNWNADLAVKLFLEDPPQDPKIITRSKRHPGSMILHLRNQDPTSSVNPAITVPMSLQGTRDHMSDNTLPTAQETQIKSEDMGSNASIPADEVDRDAEILQDVLALENARTFLDASGATSRTPLKDWNTRAMGQNMIMLRTLLLKTVAATEKILDSRQNFVAAGPATQ